MTDQKRSLRDRSNMLPVSYMLEMLESESDSESSPPIKQRRLEKSRRRPQPAPDEDFEPEPVPRARASTSSERKNANRVAQPRAPPIPEWFQGMSWSDTLGPGENKEFKASRAPKKASFL